MTNRAATFSAVILTGIAAVSLTTATDNTAAAAEECLAAPKGDAPQGAHWYYRSDRATKRKCWYVGDQREEARKKPSTVVASVKPRALPALQKSVADARAEFFDAMDQRERKIAPQPPATAPATTTEIASVAASPQPAAAGEWIMAQRWADRGDATVAATPSPAPVAPPPASEAVAEPAEPEESYLWVVMALLAGALAFGGTAIAVIVRSRRAKRTREEIREPFRVDWSTADEDEEDEESASIAPSPNDPTMKWVRIAREIQQAQNPGRDIEELLASVPRGRSPERT